MISCLAKESLISCISARIVIGERSVECMSSVPSNKRVMTGKCESVDSRFAGCVNSGNHNRCVGRLRDGTRRTSKCSGLLGLIVHPARFEPATKSPIGSGVNALDH